MIKRCDWSPEKKMHNAAINEAADVSSALSNERLCSVLILAECETKDTHVHVPVKWTASVMDRWVLQFLSMYRAEIAKSVSDVQENIANIITGWRFNGC